MRRLLVRSMGLWASAVRRWRRLRGVRDEDVAARRIVGGEAWEDFCDTLKAAGVAIQGTGAPMDPLTQAEGYRHLTRLLRAGLEAYMEYADPRAPVLRRMVHETVKMGADNVEFRLGEIEHLPVADNSVDVIVSNCVINLSPEKRQVFQEAHRVLKPGGRLHVSDVVEIKAMPESLREKAAMLTGCIAGAAPVDRIRQLLTEAGFRNVRIQIKAGSKELVGGWFPGSGAENYVASADIVAVKGS